MQKERHIPAHTPANALEDRPLSYVLNAIVVGLTHIFNLRTP